MHTTTCFANQARIFGDARTWEMFLLFCLSLLAECLRVSDNKYDQSRPRQLRRSPALLAARASVLRAADDLRAISAWLEKRAKNPRANSALSGLLAPLFLPIRERQNHLFLAGQSPSGWENGS